MKIIYNLTDYVQEELQDPRKIMFNRTKSQLFFAVVATFLTAEIGLYFMMYGV